MDESRMKTWFDQKKRSEENRINKKRALLVMDSFEDHKTNIIKNIVSNANTDLAIISDSLTSVIQPLDICLNKLFKNKLYEKWNAWMSLDQFTYTKGENLKKPDYSIICKQILEAWAEIPKEIIVKSFKKYDISNAMDESEDDLFGQNETEENNDNNDKREILNIDSDSADEYSTNKSDELDE